MSVSTRRDATLAARLRHGFLWCINCSRGAAWEATWWSYTPGGLERLFDRRLLCGREVATDQSVYLSPVCCIFRQQVMTQAVSAPEGA